jgi:hypothetical protein
MFEHEETISGRFASEMDGVGHFDIIHTHDGFEVYQGDGGLHLGCFDTLEDAVDDAKKEARAFDRATIAELRRKRG